MQYDEFVDQVQQRAGLTSRDEAEEAVTSTFESLGEGLEEGVARTVAQELPPELARHLVGMPSDLVEPMAADELVDRVSDTEEVDAITSALQVRSVLEVLARAVGPGPTETLRQALPDSYRRLLPTG